MLNLEALIPPNHLDLARAQRERTIREREPQAPKPIEDPSKIPLQFRTLPKSPGLILLDAKRQGGPEEIKKALNDRCARLFSALIAQMQRVMLAPPDVSGHGMKNTSRPAHEDYITIERAWSTPCVPSEGESPTADMTVGLGKGGSNLPERRKMLDAVLSIYDQDFGGGSEWKKKAQAERGKMLPTAIKLTMDSRTHTRLWTTLTMGGAKDVIKKTEYAEMFLTNFDEDMDSFADMMPILDIIMRKIKGHTGGTLSNEAQMLLAEIRILQQAKNTAGQTEEALRDPHAIDIGTIPQHARYQLT